MKNMLKKALLPALALSLMFVIPAIATESSSTTTTNTTTGNTQASIAAASSPSISFQIPMHDYCSVDNPFDFGFQISNANSGTANITLFLYQKDGSILQDEGISSAGLESTIIPGRSLTLAGNATAFYHMNFGNHNKCDQRIYSGKIVVNEGQASLLAKGWVYRRIGSETKLSELITINQNKSFDLIK
ncbi:hypothetical protein SAMN03159341_12910 [Paenibacillus sp. 1_12]|uniref:hypothetical protein n=1 Tax=Paenibacillus sp. 1_12 TaxID=1566278 RepID=UPI0008E3056D|nr:hypothetical protein [Paenibacillus sp. 1_12]SFM37230.1 hypothetical protein SAMN03159341_12910 [Paenibacillus sp. 1_12]